MIEIDLEKAEGPHDFALFGGPFDGSSIRMGIGLDEAHPAAIVIESDSGEARGKTRERYVLRYGEVEIGFYHEKK